ncbi:unnamed protein product [Meganyctiphanes norvegica]|uniref:Metalloendopeptidase n=1 Tax=Meganyctiphanes norvegica TaxID=48144 RepID=A0AAV2PTD4_MEGNR
MLGIAIFTLALVAEQVASYTTPPKPYTLNEGDVREYKQQIPFENSNPSRVAAGELYQSDMLLTEEQWAALRNRKAIKDVQYRWTEGSDGYPFVPYVFQDSVDQTDVGAALDHWMDHTCIKFEETSDTDQPHLQFHIGSGCWSYVGMMHFWQGQQISIGSGCNSLGTIVHEVGHAMGFHHEQARSDRDDYVIIFMDNVESGKEGNFEKADDDNHGVPYDYSSNMHYGQTYFTVNGKPTIVTIDPMAQELIGSRNGLTHRDKLLANRMYNCIGKWLEKCGLDSDPCLNDGYTGKDCTCICPPGTSGSNCESVEGDYYEDLRSPLSEKITTEKSLTVAVEDAGTTFVKWIVPPTCKTAKLTFTSGSMYSGDCYYQFMTVRTDESDLEGTEMCAADVSPGVTLTSDTGIIITFTNRVNYGGPSTVWEADVTFEDISGCTATDPPTTPAPTTPAPTTPAPTTPAPTTPAPTTPAPTTPAPTTPSEDISECGKKPNKITIKNDEELFITSPEFSSPYPENKIKCGWKLKAQKKRKLSISCQFFELNGKDKLKVNKSTFIGTDGPSVIAKKMKIKFLSKKNSSGPGFFCKVVSIEG